MESLKYINQIRTLIYENLNPLINSDCVLLDTPAYGNIGDQLIFEGELIFLDEYLKRKIKYICNLHDFNEKEITDQVILLQGGGNFGDIYQIHQNFRTKIITQFPNNRIIVLPQTVFYRDHNKLKKDCELFKSHSDLTICVRDMESYKLLNTYLDDSKLLLLPDMAFFIDLTNQINNKPNHKALLMERIDVENIGKVDLSIFNQLINQGYELDIKDWPTYYETFNNSFYRYYNFIRRKFLLRLANFGFIQHGVNDLLMKNYYSEMGIRFMNQYDFVATTRLHGLILAILLDKEILVLDNSYGKLSSFYNAWLKDFPKVRINK